MEKENGYDIFYGIARSSNGRTSVSGTDYLGSNPSLATYVNHLIQYGDY